MFVKFSLMWVICNKKNIINERKRHKKFYKAKKNDIKLSKNKDKKLSEKSQKNCY